PHLFEAFGADEVVVHPLPLPWSRGAGGDGGGKPDLWVATAYVGGDGALTDRCGPGQDRQTSVCAAGKVVFFSQTWLPVLLSDAGPDPGRDASRRSRSRP